MYISPIWIYNVIEV